MNPAMGKTARNSGKETHNGNFVYYASDIADKMKVKDSSSLQLAVKSAITICQEIGIPVGLNFKPVYRVSLSGVAKDWKLSIMGYRFLEENLIHK